MIFNATFKNIFSYVVVVSFIVVENEVPGENYRPAASHWKLYPWVFFAGSGKTTLLNTIAGKIKIASGEITLNGMRYNKQLRRRMGYVHQEDALMTRLTLYEILYVSSMIF